ncbi:unnamed protein product [Rotaria socialis]|uniref:NACHT domain-containing protein n=1 Tax=Rotaria socialis TaxID=392032 RepID=A0A818UWL0_9BILA|nr:unnamed protein product [Rotaria socialis]CAF4715563.1 unnamed protein product [Rotaria socialis]
MNSTVDAAEIVCCFMTPEYQDSINCKNELQYAREKKKHIIPCMIGDKQNKQWKPTDWLEFTVTGLNYIDFQEESDQNIRLKAEELINRIANQYSTTIEYSLVDAIKKKYLKEDKIKCILNEEDTFSIDHIYINLAIVNTKEQHKKQAKPSKYEMKSTANPEKEQDYHWKRYDSTVLGAYEDIYGDQTQTDIEGIFGSSSAPIKKVQILGRPKIGKSTFCQYVTYRWAKGKLWSRYELVVLIDFLQLNNTRYPATKIYTLVDLIEREYTPLGGLSQKEKKSFLQKCNNGNVLWILDGYDELAANIPEQLKQCFDDIHEKQNCILMSLSDDIVISCDVKMKIMGLIHADISRYIGHFFRRIEGELPNASSEGQKLLDFLYSNRSICRAVSIPVNLELICRLWVDPHQLETKVSTMTALYEKFVVWLCRRQITKDNKNLEQMTKDAVYKEFDRELQFLEYLAFKTVESDKIILPSDLVQEATRETGCDLHEYSRVLQMGILKPYDKKSFENQNETTKHYYFIHPSYQEFFAARHLLRVLKSSNDNEATHFISHQKYNQRFRLMFIFATGLLAESHYQACINTFWTKIQGEPMDLGGLQHLQLLTECIDELGDSDVFDDRLNIVNKLWHLFKTFFDIEANVVKDNMIAILSKTSTIFQNKLMQNNLAQLLYISDESQKCRLLRLISQLPVLQPTEKLFSVLLRQLRDSSVSIRQGACTVLGNIGANTVTKQLTDGLVKALGDNHWLVRIAACKALGKLNKNAVTNNIIGGLIEALGANSGDITTAACNALVKLSEKVTMNLVIDGLAHALARHKNFLVRIHACEILGKIAEKTPINETIVVLMNALDDKAISVNDSAHKVLMKLSKIESADKVITALIHALAVHENYQVRKRACKILREIAETAPTNDVLAALINALNDIAFDVSRSAHEALMKLGGKVSTSEAITGLINVLRPNSNWIQICVFQVLGSIGEKAATNEVLTILLKGLCDSNADIQINACKALEKFGEKAATEDVILGLSKALYDKNVDARQNACQVLVKIGETAATNQVLTILLEALRDSKADIRKNACQALGRFGGNAATEGVISALSYVLHDNDPGVRINACQALGKFGGKAATEDVISSLSKALYDYNTDIQKNACQALGKIGESSATNEVLTVILKAFNDKHGSIRQIACNVLGDMGERAITANVITALLNACNDRDSNVRRSACEALVKLAEKASTNEVIVGLNNALGHENVNVRKSACHTLAQILEKAARLETISALFNALADKDRDVRSTACIALRNFGKKAVTNELIVGLIEALGNNDLNVRIEACSILSDIGDKAGTNEVIAALHSVLRAADKDMEFWICIALRKIGEKIANDKVIDYLVSILIDKNSSNQRSACEALSNMGKKAITKKVLAGLVDALGDKSVYLRESACETLAKLGEKAATENVLGGLTNAMRNNVNYPERIREKACKALGSMGEKSATSAVIAGLVEALRDKEWDRDIRREACDTLGKIGKKAATKAVLQGLIDVIHDKDRDWTSDHGEEACKTLVKFGEKAVTHEVITGLLNALGSKNASYSVERGVFGAIVKLSESAKTNQVIVCLVERFFFKGNNVIDSDKPKALTSAMHSYAALKDLDTDMIVKLTQCLKQCVNIELATMPRNQFIRVFLETRNDAWIPLVEYATLLQNVAVTIMDNKVMIYDGKYVAEQQVTEPGVLELLKKKRPLYADITLTPTMTSDFDAHQVLLESEEFTVLDINSGKLSCKGHPCPSCGQCRDWYFTGNGAELAWLRDEQHWNHEGDAWNRWLNDRLYLKFKPRDGKTCVGRHSFIFPFTIGKYDYGFHVGEGDFPHGPVGYARAVPLAENIPYDYEGYYSDFCACEDNVVA